MTQARTKPIWRHFTADKPARTKVSRRPKKMTNNPLTNVFKRAKTSKSTSKTLPKTKLITKPDNLIAWMFIKIGKSRSTSRVQPILVVEQQCIMDRFGDVPN
jgi:hypothetical protein